MNLNLEVLRLIVAEERLQFVIGKTVSLRTVPAAATDPLERDTIRQKYANRYRGHSHDVLLLL
jgi:hypothetical protein